MSSDILDLFFATNRAAGSRNADAGAKILCLGSNYFTAPAAPPAAPASKPSAPLPGGLLSPGFIAALDPRVPVHETVNPIPGPFAVGGKDNQADHDEERAVHQGKNPACQANGKKNASGQDV